MRPFSQPPTVAAWLTLVACTPAFAQSTITYGLEIAFRSGHADRGYLISDRPVIQPVAWLSAGGADLSAWGNLPVTETTDRSLPKILELELTRALEWGKFSIGPAVRMWFYRDPLSPYSTRSLEGWLYLSYDAGPFRLFTHHSLDVLTYSGAYFADAGIASEGRVSQRLEIGGSLSAGWGSAKFNDAWFGVVTPALNRVRAEGWLTTHVTPQLYIGPRFELNTTVDRTVRAAHIRPTYLLVGLALGGDF